MATFKINNGDSITFAFSLTGVEAADILNLEFAIGNLSYTLANGKLEQSNNNPLLFYVYMLSKDTFCLNGNYPISVSINTALLGVLKKNLVGNLSVTKTNTKMNLPVPTQVITATYNFTVDTNGIIVNEFLATIAKGEKGDSYAETFETVSKNLKGKPYVLNYTSGKLTSIVYTVTGGNITKTLNYTGEKLTSIVLSGNTPGGINLTKTLSYTVDSLTNITYS